MAYGFLSSAILPERESIKAQCMAAGFHGGTGFPLHDADSGAIVAWVKYGPYVTVAEARTQDFVAQELARRPGSELKVARVFDAFEWEHPACTVGCIVMEHVDGADCGPGDVDAVAGAVQTLLGIRGPDLVPGHVGGGRFFHPFFLDYVAPARYASVADLQEHINNILNDRGDSRRVDIVSEAAHAGGLFLCPCDIVPANFRRSADGQLFALDFGASCFLPPSFFALAMSLTAAKRFCRRVAKRVAYSQPAGDVAAMVAASFYLAQHGGRPIGLPQRLQASSSKPPSPVVRRP